MYKSIVVVLLVCFLSVCSSLTLEDFEDVQHYESASNGYWPMPGANIENNGYSDMGNIDFDTSTPRQLLTNDEGETRSPPVMDRNGFVYTIQKTNHSNNIPICTIECYDPSKNDMHLWSRDLPGYPLDGPCAQALIAFNTGSSFMVLVDAHLYLITLNQNNSVVPAPTLPYIMSYTSSILIPLTEHYFLIDDVATRDLHVVYYFVESNCTNGTTHDNCSGEVVFVDRATGFKTDADHPPAAHLVQSRASATGLQDAPSMYVFVADDDTLSAYSVETGQTKWNNVLTSPQKFMSNVVVATEPDHAIVFALVVTNNLNSEIDLHGYDVNGTQIYQEKLYGPGGEERSAGRLSVDIWNHKVIAMTEQAPSNNTIVYAFDYHNLTLTNRTLDESTYQGPMSIDWHGRYYIITSQYSGYLVLSSSDLSTVDQVLNTTAGEINGVNRNYAALGDNTLVVTGSNGVIGFAPPVEHHSSGGGTNHTVIILLCVFGGLVLIVLILALAGLGYHYYNKNRRSGYEQI